MNRGWTDARALVVALVWIPSVLWCDRFADLPGQLVLGAITWALLLFWLAHETRLVRAQTAVVVAIAAVIELVFSGWLGVYVYRLEHVPMYVFPGHGLIYLAALTFGRLPAVRRHATLAVQLTVVVAGAWALWGLLLSPRRDVLGFAWYLCLLAFLRWGRSTLLYVGAFVVVSYLEILGTAWGVWAWMPVDTIMGWVPMGNPPSIAAGGYGWFDLYAVLLAPGLVRWWDRWRGRAPDETAAAGANPDAVTAGAGAQDSASMTASWSSPLDETPLPRSGPSTPSTPENRPPASVTITETPATS
jgi:hypothetical protein